MTDVATLFAKTPLLRSLSEEEYDRLAERSRLSTIQRSEAIWLHGAEVDFVGLVVSGFVKMARYDASGHEMTLEIFGPNQVFGLMGVLDGSGCPMSAVAVTTVTYLRIPKTAIEAVYDSNHVFKDHLLRKAALRMHQKLELMMKLATGTVEQKIAAILIILLDSYGHDAATGRVVLDVPLTRQELGELAGTTTETAIRVLSKWRKQGWLDSVDHKFEIERTRLLAAAE
jgi:CRP/FNR family transcriptional regulator